MNSSSILQNLKILNNTINIIMQKISKKFPHLTTNTDNIWDGLSISNHTEILSQTTAYVQNKDFMTSSAALFFHFPLKLGFTWVQDLHNWVDWPSLTEQIPFCLNSQSIWGYVSKTNRNWTHMCNISRNRILQSHILLIILGENKTSGSKWFSSGYIFRLYGRWQTLSTHIDTG